MGGGAPVGPPAGLKIAPVDQTAVLITSSAGNRHDFHQTLPTRIPGTGSSPPAAA
jgi:hypothetical protein